MSKPDYTGRELPLLIAAQNATPTPQDIREQVDVHFFRFMHLSPTRHITTRCRICGESISIQCGVEEEPDWELLQSRLEYHQKNCRPWK